MDNNKDFFEEENYDEDEEVSVLYLTFDEGEEVACDILGLFEVEDKEYIALLAEDEDEILLYEFREEGEEFDLIPIEDEEELNLAYEAYVALFEEDYDEEMEYDEE